MLHEPVTVPTRLLSQATDEANLGALHITLADTPLWIEPAAARHTGHTALQQIRELARDADLVDTLLTLTRPDVEYYGWFTRQTTTTAVLAAALGPDAMLALRCADEVTLAPTDPAYLAETLLGHIPDVPPAPGPAINFPRNTSRAEDTTQDGRNTDPLSPILKTPAVGAGEFHIAIRRQGRRREIPHPITYYDTTAGRWWLQVVLSHGDEWVVAAPATTALLLTRLHEAHHALIHDETLRGQAH